MQSVIASTLILVLNYYLFRLYNSLFENCIHYLLLIYFQLFFSLEKILEQHSVHILSITLKKWSELLIDLTSDSINTNNYVCLTLIIHTLQLTVCNLSRL